MDIERYSNWFIKRVGVLDRGYVELVNWMGDDREVAEAAWVSTKSCEER